ncbi:MAG TPA: hypothetical protein VGN59_15335 [Acidimicrobiia bacterium]|jgi:uncharacterized cupredoxin-like copper-binding protein
MVACCAGLLALGTPIAAGAAVRHHGPSHSANVEERDFHITAPTRLPAGAVVLRVENKGPDDHELLVVRTGARTLPLRSDGVTVDEDRLEPQLAGVLEAGQPGSLRTLRLHLRPGHYEMFCNMSGHYLGGMHARFVVHR